jgi:CubicO group peptidase (beta-lactamase class C family)
VVQRVTGRPFSQVVREEIAERSTSTACTSAAPQNQLHVPQAAVVEPGRAVYGTARWLQGHAHEIGELAEGAAGLVQRPARSGRDRLRPCRASSTRSRRAGIGDFDFGADATLRAAIPAANGLFTARDRSLAMYACLAGGGAIDGVRLLRPRRWRRRPRLQLRSHAAWSFPFDMRWRLGYHGVFTTQGVPRHAFGHFGFGGSGAWADPSRDLAVALIVNSGLGTPFGDFRPRA